MTDIAEHTEVYRGYKIAIFTDSDPSNPRTEYENLGHMICHHRRHTLGDKHSYSEPNDFFEAIAGGTPNAKHHHPITELMGDGSEHRIIWEPLYLCDHSGITISTTPFSCRWDSGMVGIIYMTYDEIATAQGITIDPYAPFMPSDELKEKYRAMLIGEVKTYDDYITGQVYGYCIYGANTDPEPEADEAPLFEEDSESSCWGFFGDYNAEYGAVAAAKEEINAIVEKG